MASEWNGAYSRRTTICLSRRRLRRGAARRNNLYRERAGTRSRKRVIKEIPFRPGRHAKDKFHQSRPEVVLLMASKEFNNWLRPSRPFLEVSERLRLTLANGTGRISRARRSQDDLSRLDGRAARVESRRYLNGLSRVILGCRIWRSGRSGLGSNHCVLRWPVGLMGIRRKIFPYMRKGFYLTSRSWEKVLICISIFNPV